MMKAELSNANRKLNENADHILFKDNQIKELAEELNEREAMALSLMQRKHEDSSREWDEEKRCLHAEVNTLKREIEFADREMAEIKGDNDILREQVRKYSQEVENAREKLEIYKEKVGKYEESAKVQEVSLTVCSRSDL